VDWSGVLHGLLFFLPAYVANMSPPLVAKVVPRWNAPIDSGRLHKDGRRLLGAGKTWRGLAGAALAGAATAAIVASVVPAYDHAGLFAGWDFGHKGSWGTPPIRQASPSCVQACPPMAHVTGPVPLWRIALFGAALGLFALVGDAVKSYFKRRRGKEGGAPWVPFDQLDFVLFGLAAALAFSWLLAPHWVWDALTGEWLVPATIILLTPALHFVVNVLGYWLRLKEVPW